METQIEHYTFGWSSEFLAAFHAIGALRFLVLCGLVALLVGSFIVGVELGTFATPAKESLNFGL